MGLISQGDSLGSLREYLLEDGMGNIRLITDNGGGLRQSFYYDPFGSLRPNSSIFDFPFTFAGQFREPENGLFYMRARHYDPAIGRFIEQDPVKGDLRIPQTFNPYAYVLNNPVNLSDPSGRFFTPETAWDVANLGYDIATFNPCDPWSYINTGADALSTAVPILPAGLTKVGKVANIVGDSKVVNFTENQLRMFEKQLAEHGKSSLEKSRESFQNLLTEHQAKLREYQASGGHISSVEKEIINFQQQINAIDELLRK